jgi:hypothetical protein
MKKLVKLDEDFRLTEIDWKATRRQAERLRDYIKNAPAAECAQYGYQKHFIPLVDSVMNGSIDIPYSGPDPYSIRAIMEGQVPDFVDSFASIFFRFDFMIKADPSVFSLSTHENGKDIFEKDRVEKDGELYQWCWFED